MHNFTKYFTEYKQLKLLLSGHVLYITANDVQIKPNAHKRKVEAHISCFLKDFCL